MNVNQNYVNKQMLKNDANEIDDRTNNVNYCINIAAPATITNNNNSDCIDPNDCDANNADRNNNTLTTVVMPYSPPIPIGYITFYSLTDHLGSASITTDHQGNFLQREEYSPYGMTMLFS